MGILTNTRFWIYGAILAAVPVAAMLRDYGMLGLTGWPDQVLDFYVMWRVRGTDLLADLLMMVSSGVRGMAGDAVNVILILLALFLATVLSRHRDEDDDDKAASNSDSAGGKPPVK